MLRIVRILTAFCLLAGSAQAAITGSVIVEDSPQADGRRYVRERHTDHVGQTHDVLYLAAAETNAASVMAARVASINAQLTQGEIEKNLANAVPGYTPTFVHSTAAQNRAAFREKFKTAKGWELTELGAFINSLSLSDAQLQALFGVSAGAQLNALKTKLSNCTTRYNAVIAEAGQ